MQKIENIAFDPFPDPDRLIRISKYIYVSKRYNRRQNMSFVMKCCKYNILVNNFDKF